MCVHLCWHIYFITYCKWFMLFFIIHISPSCFIWVHDKRWSLQNQVRQAQESLRVEPGCISVQCFTPENTSRCVAMHIFSTLIRYGRVTLLLLSCSYATMHQDQKWPTVHELSGPQGPKNPLVHAKCKIGYIFVVRTREIKWNLRENTKEQKHKNLLTFSTAVMGIWLRQYTKCVNS
jgi:hypothetical protein